jgi:hypothetical protein
MNNSQMDNIIEELVKIKNDYKNDIEYVRKMMGLSNQKIETNEKMI